MCGILIHIGNEVITPEHPALEIIRHRGPDGRGAIAFPLENFNVCLGHRRLSIIDLSERGSQPMPYEDDSLWTVFNGEIYNYIEIKAELQASGFEFHTGSDTEVLLASYRKWGKQCMSKFNGMFSFCIYDKRENRIFMARDRFGIKPLYYWNSTKGFYAASEIKQLTAVPGFTPTVNPEKLYHFLNSSDFDFDRETMWRDVFEIEPGHCVEINLKTWKPGDDLRIEKWYGLDYDRKINLSFDDAICEFRKLLNDSVKLRMRADVPVGFLLSGGLDSSTLVGIASKIPREENAILKTFSSCYENSPVDERKFINEMLDFTKASSSLHFPKPQDVADNMDKIIWHNDIPVRHGSPAPHWLLYKHIREDNDFRKVIIEGQGGDEILCGYRDFFWSMIYELLSSGKIPQFMHQLSSVRSRHGYSSKIILRKLGRLAFPGSVSYPANPAIIPEALIGTGRVPEIPIRREQPTIKDMHQARLKIIRYILHNVDRNSMAHSRETRVPFLDYKLVEFCVNIQTSYKISDGTTKRILRESVKDVIPEKIRNRGDKQGYSSPIPTWLGKDLVGFFRDNIEDAVKLPFANRNLVLRETGEFLSGKRQFNPVWWNLMTANRWIKMFKMSV